MVLSDGSSVECDDEHLWIVGSGDARLHGASARQSRGRGAAVKVLTTREIRHDLLSRDGSPKWCLPEAVPVDLRRPRPRSTTTRTSSGLKLAADGAAAGVPRAFMDNSVKNRLALLQGLLDAGGRAGAR